MKPPTNFLIAFLLLVALGLGAQQTNFYGTVFSTAISAVSYNATGAIPFLVNGAQATCAILSDCSTLETITGAFSPTNKNFLTGNNGNSIQLLCQQGSLGAITGTGVSAIQAVYTCTLPQNTPGPGKCIDAKVAFIHTGANSITYNWSFVLHSGALVNSGTPITQTAATAAGNELILCNGAGVQNAQTLNQNISYFGGNIAAGGVTTTVIDITTAGGADLTFTFNAGVNVDTVAPKAFIVTELL